MYLMYVRKYMQIAVRASSDAKRHLLRENRYIYIVSHHLHMDRHQYADHQAGDYTCSQNPPGSVVGGGGSVALVQVEPNIRAYHRQGHSSNSNRIACTGCFLVTQPAILSRQHTSKISRMPAFEDDKYLHVS